MSNDVSQMNLDLKRVSVCHSVSPPAMLASQIRVPVGFPVASPMTQFPNVLGQ